MALITTYEGVVEKGHIRLKKGVRLPETVMVYVIVPEQMKKKENCASPHAEVGKSNLR